MSNTCAYDPESTFDKIVSATKLKLETNRSLGSTFEGFYNVLRNTIYELVKNNLFLASAMSDEDKLNLIDDLGLFGFGDILFKFKVDGFNDEKVSGLLSAFSVTETYKNPTDETENPKISDNTLLSGKFDDTVEENFLATAYLNSPRARMYAENLGREKIVKSFLYTEELTDLGIRKSIITNQCDLERAITKTQQQLLEKIAEYILSSSDYVLDEKIKEYNKSRNTPIKKETILGHLLNPTIYNPKRPNLLSGFDMILRYFKDFFTRPGDLEDLIDNLNSPNPDASKKLILDAYNAYILLDNFDEFVKMLFGDLINIDRQKPRFSPSRYTLKNEGSNLFTTFRTTDEIWLDKEVNKIAQLIIGTTRKYNQLTKTPLENEYLTFNGFVRSIGRLKTLMKGTINNSTQEDDFEFFKNNGNFSQSTLIYINKHNIKTMRLLICSSRLYPEECWNVIFDILANTESIERLNNLFGADAKSGFQREDLNNYYTIWKELIGSDSSLSGSVNANIAKTSYNYASYLTLVIDSMFETSYLQYYVTENGDIEIRPLRDMVGTQFRRAKERKINNQLSLIKYTEFKDRFKIQIVKDNNKVIVKFKVGDADIEYNPRSDSYGLTINGVPDINKELVEEILGINLSSDIIKGLNNTLKNPNTPQYTNAQDVIERLKGLKELVLKAIARTAINNELLRFTDKSGNTPIIGGNVLNSKRKLAGKIKDIYGSEIGINVASRGTNILDAKGNRGGNELPLLEALALAELYSLGLITSSQIKSGDGNSVSANALSRLADSYPHLWYYLNFNDRSATRHFLLLNNPAFLGLFQVKELKDENSVLASEDMTEGDMITSNFIHDFIGLLSKKSNIDKVMYIIPQVISDKKFIGRLGINLSQTIDISYLGYPDIETWEDIINSPDYENIMTAIILNDFSLFFTQAFLNINEDFNLVTKNLERVLPKNIVDSLFSEYFELTYNEYIGDLLNDDIFINLLKDYQIDNVTPNLIRTLLKSEYYTIEQLYLELTGRQLNIFDENIINDSDFLHILNEYFGYEIDSSIPLVISRLQNESFLPSWEELKSKYDKLIESEETLYQVSQYIFADLNNFNNLYKNVISKHNNNIIDNIPGLKEYVYERLVDKSLSVYDVILKLNREEFENLINSFEQQTGIVVESNVFDSFIKLTPSLLLYEVTKSYNLEHPATPIELIDLVHFISEKNGDITPNPVLLESLRRFNTIDSVKEFFNNEVLITASNMIDKGFSYTISEKEKGTTDSSVLKALESKGWLSNGKVIICKVTTPIKIPTKGIEERTFNITDRESLRNILEYIDKNRNYKGNAQIEREVISKVLSREEIQRVEQIVRKTLKDSGLSDEKIDNNLLFEANKELFPLYIERVRQSLTQERVSEIQTLYPELSQDDAVTRYIQKEYFTQRDELKNELRKQILKDRLKTIEELAKENPELNILINPYIYKYSTLDYLFSEEWIISTVGHHYAHPDKKYDSKKVSSIDYLIKTEANRKEAQNKRNVSVTATMHEFLLDMLSGIPSTYNIAVIKDVKDVLYNVFGLVDTGVKPYDGATFVNPFIVYLENNSLGGSRAGVVKKLFVHFYNERTGTGGIIKTAGFGGTNMLARNSYRWRSMIKSMTDRQWVATEKIGSYNPNDKIKAEDADITKDFNGNTLNYPKVYFKNESGQFIEREILEYNGNYSYKVRDIIVDPENGNQIEGTKIDIHSIDNVNTNYNVWKLFGGEWAYELTSSGKLIPSEMSIALTVEAINNVGIKKHNGEVKTQSDVYQFMKHSDIHYIATEGAVKQGAANINSIEAYNNGELLNFQRVKMLLAGIQLDKEHSADGEDVSLMTQVISACVSRGFTFDKADKLYKALAKIAEIGLGDDLKAITDLIQSETTENKERVQELVVDSYLKSLATDSNPNVLATKIAGRIIQELNEGKIINRESKLGLIPFSDPGIYNLLITKLSVAITKSAIKIKIDGVLSMLCPSFGILKLYGDKMLGEYLSPNELEEAQNIANSFNLLNSPERILIGRTYNITYKDGTVKKVLIQTPLIYYDIRKNLNSIESIVENIQEGRDLNHYNCFFRVGAKRYSIYDLLSVYRLFEARKNNASREELIELEKDLQRDLLNLKKNGVVNVVEGDIISEVTISKIDEIIPYEVILPKFFQTSFGLDPNDNLSEINEEYFFKKQRDNFLPQIPDNAYDVCLKRANGDHVYIKLKSRQRNIQHTPIKIKKTSSIKKGKVHRIDPDTGSVIYELSSKEDNILQYTDLKGRSFEVIETDNIEHYLKTQDGIWDMYISSSSDYLNKVEQYSRDRNSQILKESDILSNYIRNYKNSKLRLSEYNLLMRDGSTSESQDVTGYKQKIFRERAKRMYASFRKALELVAARIPAQSMQSFMPMRIVGFDNSGTNTAYVSTAQIWLQGSDFDIDTATFTRYSTGKDGHFVHWSGIADLSSYEALKACDELPFPTNQLCNRELSDTITGETFVLHDMRNPLLNILKESNEKSESIDELYIDFSGFDFGGNTSVEKVNKFNDLLRFVALNGINNLTYIDINGEEKRFSEEQYKYIADQIDRHNTWLFKKNNNYQLDAIKNFLLTQMYNIIVSPENLILAQTPVDTATDIVKNPLKDDTLKDAVLAAKAIPGDPTVKVTGIYKNQTGKKGVGICATALKSYFAAFLLNQTVLFNKKATKSELKRLILGKSGITIKGKTYYGLANTYCPTDVNGNPLPSITDEQAKAISERLIRESEGNLELNPVTEDELRQLITHITEQGIDGAIILSAMLSLATDNAKEGSLGKLNAGTKTLGLYMYGIVLGMNFDELAKIMMSDSAREITKLMEGNAFNHKIGLNSVENAIEYITEGPTKELKSLFVKTHNPGVYKYIAKSIYKHVFDLKYKDDVEKHFDELWDSSSKTEKGTIIADDTTVFINFLKSVFKDEGEYYNVDRINQVYSFASKMAIDEELVFGPRNNKHTNESKEFWEIIANYSNLQSVVRSDSANFNALVTLSRGAGELRLLGQILKLNQGLPSKSDEIITLIDKFESLCGLITDENGVSTKFSIREYLTDPEKWINAYEAKNKVAINILDVLDKTPHFKKYLESLMVFDEKSKASSVKYRLLRSLPSMAKTRLGGMSDQQSSIALNSRIRRMADDWIMSEFLISKNISFIIPKGLEYYDVNGNKVIAKDNVRIHLGTYSGRASFKLWMELTVIPNLKKGFNGSRNEITLKRNKFISDLQINGYDNTPNHINMNAYSLPINMSPRTDLEEVIFRKYKSLFNLLAQTANNGEMSEDKIYHSGDETYNIYELFFLYNIAAFLNLPGEANLKKIFEDLSDVGLIKDFYLFEAEYDRTSNITAQDIPESYWKYWAAPVGSVFGTNSRLIFSLDKNEFDRVLMRPAVAEDYGEDEENRISTKKNKYGRDYVNAGLSRYSPDFIGFSSEIRHVMSGVSSTLYNLDNATISVVMNHNHIVAIDIGDKTIYLEKAIPLSNITISGNSGSSGAYDISEVENYINTFLNPC